jgi:hypothetical protein
MTDPVTDISLKDIFMFGMTTFPYGKRTYPINVCCAVARLCGFSLSQIGKYTYKEESEISRNIKQANQSDVDELLSSIMYLKDKERKKQSNEI